MDRTYETSDDMKITYVKDVYTCFKDRVGFKSIELTLLKIL